ncbi:hypothetical protein [Halobacillus sp. H74]|uniref:hypothetical protein n=1 Tax=Halobacillus sp. H74 TaxID=3457436 RepID=UPI003FCD81B2
MIKNKGANLIERFVFFFYLKEILVFNKKEFVRILVHFDIPEDELKKRVNQSDRNINIFRGDYSSFYEVLERQQKEACEEGVRDPEENEADYLFLVHDNEEVETVIKKIVQIRKG